MNIINQYICRNWIKIFFISVVALFLLVAFGDIVNNILRNKYTLEQTFRNFFYQTSDIFTRIIPVSCLISTLFTINKFKSKNELTAIIATGYSPQKIIHSFLALSFCVSLMQLLNAGYYSSFLYALKIGDTQNSSAQVGKTWFKGSNYFGSFIFFDQIEKILVEPQIYFFSDHLLTKIVKGKKSVYKGDANWEFHDSTIISSLSERDIFQTKQHEELTMVTLDEKISDLQKYQSGVYALYIHSFYKFITKLRDAGINVREYLIDLYSKIGSSLNCLLFALFPVILLNKIDKRHSSTGKALILTLIFSIGYWVLESYLKSMGMGPNLPPLLTSFALHVAMGLFLLQKYFSLEKLS